MAEEKEKPLTREDILRLIKENGGTAEGLDLSGKRFEESIDLSDLDLHGIILKGARFPTQFEGNLLVGAKFDGTNLSGADLRNANLQFATFNTLKSKAASLQYADLKGARLENAEFREADLTAAQFQGQPKQFIPAYLSDTDFRGANLFLANFKGCYFYGTQLEGTHIRGADIFEAHLAEADWGSYLIGEEKSKEFHFAENYYRRLKLWYQEHGMYNRAAKFYYREKEAGRKGAKRRLDHIAGWLSWAVFGHGEGWKRILFWIAGFILLFALIYFAFDETRQWQYFGDYIYFSTVSFTALGYGSWLHVTNNWIKGIGAFESIAGVFMMALLLVTFVRKWTR